MFLSVSFIPVNIRLCKWLKQLDSKLSPVKGFMGSNPLSMSNLNISGRTRLSLLVGNP